MSGSTPGSDDRRVLRGSAPGDSVGIASDTSDRTTDRGANGVIRAFGGAVWRQGGAGVEVLLVHRPAYEDWSLPKGKLDAGEGPVECALREVQEETGITCEVGPELLTVRYDERDKRKGRTMSKEVTFFEMTPVSERERPPDDEIDAMQWLPLAEARRTCSYQTDVQVLDRLEALVSARSATKGSSGGGSSSGA